MVTGIHLIVNHDTYQDLAPESRVLVRYSATDPEVVRLEGQSKTFVSLQQAFVGQLMLQAENDEPALALLARIRAQTSPGKS
jgi:hypothetical protein